MALPVDDLPRIVHVFRPEREEEPDVNVPEESCPHPRGHAVEILSDGHDVEPELRPLAEHVCEGRDGVVVDLVEDQVDRPVCSSAPLDGGPQLSEVDCAEEVAPRRLPARLWRGSGGAGGVRAAGGTKPRGPAGRAQSSGGSWWRFCRPCRAMTS